jgi:hypothetical protein
MTINQSSEVCFNIAVILLLSIIVLMLSVVIWLLTSEQALRSREVRKTPLDRPHLEQSWEELTSCRQHGCVFCSWAASNEAFLSRSVVTNVAIFFMKGLSQRLLSNNVKSSQLDKPA